MTNKSKLVYVAGPFSSDDFHEAKDNYQEAVKWVTEIRKRGYPAFSPHMNSTGDIDRWPESLRWADYLDEDIAVIKAVGENWHAFVVTPGWEDSKGARIEAAVFREFVGLDPIPVEVFLNGKSANIAPPENTFEMEIVADEMIKCGDAIILIPLAVEDAYLARLLQGNDLSKENRLLANAAEDISAGDYCKLMQDGDRILLRKWLNIDDEYTATPEPKFSLADMVAEVTPENLHKTYAGIGISGKAGSGKDTLAEMLWERLDTLHSRKDGQRNYEIWNIVHFADELKKEWFKTRHPSFYVKHDNHYESPIEIVNRLKNEEPIIRENLIEFGAKRRAQDPNYWIKKINFSEKLIIPDVRFKNEFDCLKDKGFYMVRVEAHEELRIARDGQGDIDDPSETELDGETGWNYWAENDSTIERLQEQADKIVELLKGESFATTGHNRGGSR